MCEVNEVEGCEVGEVEDVRSWSAISTKSKACEVGEVKGVWSWPLSSPAKSKGVIWVRFEVKVERRSGFVAWSGFVASVSLCARVRKWFKVKIFTSNHFRPRSLILRSNWKYFQFDPIFRTYQTCYFLEKDFWIPFEVKKYRALIPLSLKLLKFLNQPYLVFPHFYFIILLSAIIYFVDVSLCPKILP